MADKIDTTLLSLRGRMGGHAVHAMYDSRYLTQAATKASQTALDRRLIEQYHLDSEAPDFDTRLGHARSSFWAGMQRKSVLSRKKKRQQRERRASRDSQ